MQSCGGKVILNVYYFHYLITDCCVVAEGSHINGIVMYGLELVYAEAGVGHNHAAAVPIEPVVKCLQLMEVDLQRIKTRHDLIQHSCFLLVY